MATAIRRPGTHAEHDRLRRKEKRRLLKTSANKAAAEENTGGVPLGYVEDFSEVRTTLAGVLSSLR
jgi:hypothetical protein